MYSRLPAFLILLFFGCFLIGCSEDLATSALDRSLVTGVEAASLSPSSVALRWKSSDTTITGFVVAFRGSILRDTGEQRVAAAIRSVRFDNLGGGAYEFTIIPVRGAEQLVSTSIRWAGARRYDRDPKTGAPLRLYERFSSKASGLSFDVISVAPAITDLTLPVTFPPTPVALRIETAALTSTEFSIGPPAAYINNGSTFDSIAAISDKAYAVESLDTWFLSGPIAGMIRSDGNLSAFNRIPAAPGNRTGVGFVLRIGLGTNDFPYHYARVLVRNNNGRLLQGNAPDRYVELEISFQPIANTPYARRAPSPILYHAERRF